MAQQLTREAYERLSTELEELKTVGRTRIAQAIEAARALGDLSENGDYHAAKDEQGRMEARIRQLEAMLKSPEIIESASTDVVGPGSIVSIRFEGDDAVERYIVGDLAEAREGVEALTSESPLGQALLGKKPGDKVDYQTPTGATLTVEVVEVGA